MIKRADLQLTDQEDRLTIPPLGHGPDRQSGHDPALAEWWRRLLGWLIDSTIISVLTAATWIPIVHAYVRNYRTMINNPDMDIPSLQAVTPHVIDLGMLSAIASACIAVTYYWLLTALCGATIGKRALGIRVAASAGRARAGQRAALIRAMVFVVGGAIIPLFAISLYVNFLFAFAAPLSFLPVFFVVDNLWLLGDRQRQCLHDKAAGTVVVKYGRKVQLRPGTTTAIANRYPPV
jgi:uncharacterized RDD family membrane protein YckC